MLVILQLSLFIAGCGDSKEEAPLADSAGSAQGDSAETSDGDGGASDDGGDGGDGGATAGTDDPSDDPEGGPECDACGWYCTCETGSAVPSDWSDCSVGYDCLDHCINPQDSPMAAWYECMMEVGEADCDRISECGTPEF